MSEVKAKNTASGEDKNSPRLPATHTCTLIYSLANTLLLLAHTCLTHKALSLPASTHLRSCCLLRKNSKWESIRFDDMYVKETEEGWSRMLYKLNRRKGWKVNLSFGGNGRRFFFSGQIVWGKQTSVFVVGQRKGIDLRQTVHTMQSSGFNKLCKGG